MPYNFAHNAVYVLLKCHHWNWNWNWKNRINPSSDVRPCSLRKEMTQRRKRDAKDAAAKTEVGTIPTRFGNVAEQR